MSSSRGSSDPGIEPKSLHLARWQADSLLLSHLLPESVYTLNTTPIKILLGFVCVCKISQRDSRIYVKSKRLSYQASFED